ncbi:MAG: hypothetical protein U5J83_18805 [Bryobacterales bacterium]|nr:hypothetical protein [Bryobacterales bacterium]
MVPLSAQDIAPIEDNDSKVTVSVLNAEDHLLRTVRESLPGTQRADAIADYFERFPESVNLDIVCELDLSNRPAPANPAAFLDTAERLLARNCLQARACNMALPALAESTDSEERLRWAKRCHQVSTSERGAAGASDAASNQARAASAQALGKLAEYQVFLLSWNARGSAAQRYLDELRGLNPQSDYVGALYDRSLHEAIAKGDMPRVQALGARRLQADPDNVTALLAVANSALTTRQGLDQIMPLTARAIAALDRAEAEAATPGSAGSERMLLLRRQRGQALWIQGTYFAMHRRWQEADATLRRSLPLVQETQSMFASALYYLGLANGQLDKKSGQPAGNSRCNPIPRAVCRHQ